MPEPHSGGLRGDHIRDWQRRLRALGGAPAAQPHQRLAGARARRFYGLADGTDSLDDGFEMCMYSGALTVMDSAVAVLHTPVPPTARPRADPRAGPARNDGLVVAALINSPSRALLVGRQAIGPAQESAIPLEIAGLVIPREVFGDRRLAEGPRDGLAVLADTLLANATAAFVARFAVCAATGADMHRDAAAEHAAVDLIAQAVGEPAGAQTQLRDSPVLLREAVRDSIERRYRDPAFDVEAVAAELFLSRRHLYRAFEGADQSLAGMIAERRIIAAKGLLRTEPQASLTVVARRCGFASVDTFRNRFRALTGVGPSDYRAAVLADEQISERATTD